jgi:hypothetical protein
MVVMKSIIFWGMMPCSLLSMKRRFGGTYRLHLQGRRHNFSKNQEASRWQEFCLLVLGKIIFSTLKMEAICSSETSLDTQQTTRRHTPEDDTLQFFICWIYCSHGGGYWQFCLLGIKPCCSVKSGNVFEELIACIFRVCLLSASWWFLA